MSSADSWRVCLNQASETIRISDANPSRELRSDSGVAAYTGHSVWPLGNASKDCSTGLVRCSHSTKLGTTHSQTPLSCRSCGGVLCPLAIPHQERGFERTQPEMGERLCTHNYSA